MQHLLLNNPARQALALRLGELLILAACAELASWARFGGATGATAPIHLILLVCCPLLALLCFPTFGLYRQWRAVRPQSL